MASETNPRPEKGSNLLRSLSDYTVIDLETTGFDPRFDFIIEMAAARVRGGQIVDRFSSLVRPPCEIDDFISSLTGITNETVADAPAVESVLPSFLEFVGDDIVVGCNTNFDIIHVYDNCVRLYQHGFTNNYVDIRRLSRIMFPEKYHHALRNICAELKIKQVNAHRAAADVETTYKCYAALCALAEEKGVPLSVRKSTAPITAKDIKPTDDSAPDESNPLFGKVCVFTGTLERMTRADAMQYVVNIGGMCADSVTKKTDFLILGNNDYCTQIKDGKSNKQKQAEKNILKGLPTMILSENAFYEMIEEKEGE